MTTKEELEFFVANHGKECEFSDAGEIWVKRKLTGYIGGDYEFKWMGDHAQYKLCRPIPGPEYIPWTKDTFVFQPIDFGTNVKPPVSWNHQSISFNYGGNGLVTYSWQELLEKGKTLSGEPCGVRSEK